MTIAIVSLTTVCHEKEKRYDISANYPLYWVSATRVRLTPAAEMGLGCDRLAGHHAASAQRDVGHRPSLLHQRL